MRFTAILVALLPCAALAVEEQTSNQWIELERSGKDGYIYSAMIYVPEREQVLHWGIVSSRGTPRNDVRVLNVDARRWKSDYPSADSNKLPQGVWNQGRGAMLPVGTPAPSAIVHGVCWDSRRRQLVYVMKGLMAAYDPATRKWAEIKTETELHGTWAIWPDKPYAFYERGLHPEQDYDGERIEGPPPVYGPSICYDPVNDEILLFAHWGWQNPDLREATGQTSGHAGTFVYSFADNLWRRRTPQLSTDKIRAARKKTIESMAGVSRHLDQQWAQGEKLNADDLEQLRTLRKELDGPLRVEPPARAGAPMVYDFQRQAIILFGGHNGLVRTDLDGSNLKPGGLNDTWLYDVRTRQWREIRCQRRPPTQRLPMLVYDEKSEKPLLVTIEDETITTWSFDGSDWSRLFACPWKVKSSWWCAAIDSQRRLLLVNNGEATFGCRLDLAKIKPEPALEHETPSPIQPQTVPPDDPQWMAKLKQLPANQWIHPQPPRDANDRGWGTLAYDPVRGWVCYFGGGHSTYQVNDVAIYSVGANQWSHGAGDHNDYFPPITWDGCAMSFRGGPPAGHQRNIYTALDGRVYTFVGHSRRWDAEVGTKAGRRFAWFFDVDRGGIWRQREMTVELGERVPGSFARPHLSDPAGRILGFSGKLEPWDGRVTGDEAFFSIFDPRTNTLKVRRIPEPMPGAMLETRPFCYLPDRDEIFFYEYRKGHGHGTWLYDVEGNRFRKLDPPRQPGDEPRTVEYIVDQNAIFAVIGDGEQWVYSLEKNRWAPLPLKSDGPMGFARPYAQTVYAAKHGVLVNVGHQSRGVAIMRPDLSEIEWETK